MSYKQSFLLLIILSLSNQAFGQSVFAQPSYAAMLKQHVSISDKKEPNVKIDIIAFSYDRPLQLFAFLESVYKYLDNSNDIVVMYRVSNDAFNDGYGSVKNAFPEVVFYKQDADEPYGQFKPVLLDIILNKTSGDFVLFGVDDNIVTDYIDLKECAQLIEETSAYGFYFRLGKNITQCYTLRVSDAFALPPFEEVQSGVYSWQFDQGLYDWDYQNSVDFNLFKKSEIIDELEDMIYYTPNSLEAVWSRRRDRTRRGLCFEHSRMVNIPLNIVQEGKTDRNMGMLSTKELLEEFNFGFKIDVDGLYQFNNSAPQIHYVPKFIVR